MTHRADDGPIDGVDKVIADQVEFKDVLIDTDLMPKRDTVRKSYAKAWRWLNIDRLTDERPPKDKPHETLLRIIA